MRLGCKARDRWLHYLLAFSHKDYDKNSCHGFISRSVSVMGTVGPQAHPPGRGENSKGTKERKKNQQKTVAAI